MSPLPVPQGWQKYLFPKFTGGFTSSQRTDSDASDYTNIDMQRDGFSRCRRGLKQMHTDAALGVSQAVGLGYGALGDGSKVYLIVPKAASPFYASNLSDKTNIPPTMSFSSFTVPYANATKSPVFMTFYDYSGVAYTAMACDQWATLLSWDGSAGAASTLVGSPANARHVTSHLGRLYALAPPLNTLYFSDTGNPTSWPGTNKLPLSMKYGTALATASMLDRLLIFCQNGILYMTGDPTAQVYVGDVDTSLGGFQAASLMDVFGNNVLFPSGENIYQFNGSVQMLSDAVTGLPFYAGGGLAAGSWLTTSAEHLAIRTTFSASDARNTLWVYERVRYGQWNRWVYPTSTVFGATAPTQGVAKYVPYFIDGTVMPGSNGNLYLQPSIRMAYLESNPVLPSAEPDYNAIPVVSTIATRYTGFVDDRSMTRQIRRIMVMGKGTAPSVTVNFLGTNGTITTYSVPVPVGAALPLDLPIPLEGALAPPVPEFLECQIVVSAQNLFLRDLLVEWRAVRYAPGAEV